MSDSANSLNGLEQAGMMGDAGTGQLKEMAFPTVYVLVTSHVDDPHPHVEGVYLNEESAEEAADGLLDKYPIGAYDIIEERVEA